jgi:hypothetical protein
MVKRLADDEARSAQAAATHKSYAHPTTRDEVVENFLSQGCMESGLYVRREGVAPDAGEVRPSWVMNDDRCDDLEKISCGNKFHGSAFILRGDAVVDTMVYSDDGGGSPFTNSAILDEFSACRSRFWRSIRP